MSFVTADAEVLAAHAADISGIGASMCSGIAGSAPATLTIAPAGLDPVSMMASQLFGAHAAAFHTTLSDASRVHQELAANLGINSAAYADAELSNEHFVG